MTERTVISNSSAKVLNDKKSTVCIACQGYLKKCLDFPMDSIYLLPFNQ